MRRCAGVHEFVLDHSLPGGEKYRCKKCGHFATHVQRVWYELGVFDRQIEEVAESHSLMVWSPLLQMCSFSLVFGGGLGFLICLWLARRGLLGL